VPGEAAGLEYFAQVDFGPYRGPLRVDDAGALVVEDPKLALLGEHQIRLKGRRAGDWRSLTTLDPVTLHVDPYRPWVELTVEDGAVVATGQDIGSAPEDLEFAFSLDRAPYGAFTPE